MKHPITSLLAFIFAALSIATTHAETVIEISANDTMQYDQTAFEVPAGEEIKLIFINKGNLPKAAMGHNLVITKPDTNIMALGGVSAAAAATEYIPQDEANAAKIVAHTKLLGPGESDTIIFTLEAGSHPFFCSFPGHFALMKGTITAK